MTREDIDTYDRIIVAFSGGKDSLACVLRLLDMGVPRDRIELWHHDVDGGPAAERFMDWPCTADYCRKVAAALGLPLLFQWKVGGFEREMLRNATPTAPTEMQTPDGEILSAGGRGPNGARLMFPQVTADLSKRWCSAYLKIDVAARTFSNDPRFASGRFLLVTGERRQESAARSKYAEMEPHRSNTLRRRVDQWRAVIDFSEADVWALIERFRINPHPAYLIGLGRVSCMACIFGNDDQWATVLDLAPEVFWKIAVYEQEFGKTIHRTDSVVDRAARGRSYAADLPEWLRAVVMSETYDQPVFLDNWTLPRGAFRACGGPT